MLLFDVRYNAPDGSVGEWNSSSLQADNIDDDRQALIVIEHNIANLERSICNRQQQRQQMQMEESFEDGFHLPVKSSGSQLSLTSPRSPERKRCVTYTRHASFLV